MDCKTFAIITAPFSSVFLSPVFSGHLQTNAALTSIMSQGSQQASQKHLSSCPQLAYEIYQNILLELYIHSH